MVRLRVLGGAALEGPDGPLTGSATQRLRVALLTVLATADAGVSRDTLLALFWPDAEADRARHALSNAVYALRKALGEEAIVSAGTELRLSPDLVASDVGDYAAALDSGDLEAAAELYGGSLLDGFHFDSAPFEHWLDGERARLETLQRECLERLATEADRAGDALASVRWWRRAAALDRYNRRSALALIRALEASGDPAGALRQARVHATLMEELGAEPDPAVQHLADDIRERMATAASPAEPGGGGPAAPAVAASPAAGNGDVSSDASRRWRPAFVGIAVVAFIALVAALRWDAPVADPPRRIAVLPLDNLSADPDDAYFADAMTDLLTTELSRVDALTLRSRLSATRFADEGPSLGEIARALDVDAVLQGSVARDGDRARISVTLVRAAPEEHLWADTYEGDASNAFALQRSVVRDIVEAIRLTLTPEEERRLAAGEGIPTAAQEAYLRGLWRVRKFNREDMQAAIAEFETATTIAPEFVDAWVLLGEAHWLLTQPLAGDDPGDGMRKARAAAERALALDPRSAGAHVALGWVWLFSDWDAEAALRSFESATGRWTTAWIGKGFTLGVLGRFDEAGVAFDSAIAVEPFLLSARTALAEVLYMEGRLDAAEAVLAEIAALEPAFARRHMISRWIAEQRGDWPAAVTEHAAWQRAQSGPDLLADAPPPTAADRHDYWAWRRRLIALTDRRVPFFVQAQVAAGLGEMDAAFALIERAFAAREGQLALIDRDPRWMDMRADARFPAVVERVHAARGEPALLTREPG